jgi:hypothetical protein
VLLVLLWRPRLAGLSEKLAARTGWCMVILAMLPVALRLTLLANHPIPAPDLYDEFGHLFVADTLRHFRLSNPPHPFSRFFETFFILQQPTYSSIYPIGQGLALAIGWTFFGTPWAGVLLSVAAFCSLSYWMLRGWTTPGWALCGGLLTVFQFGPLNQWTNTYWGGAVSAAAGCLVFGALPRLRKGYSLSAAVALGLGLALHLLTRPYESIFLVLSVLLFCLPNWRAFVKPTLVAALIVLPALGVTLLQNKQVTGSWTTLPYSLSQYQYGVPASLTFQSRPVPHRELTREQDLDYSMQRGFRSTETDTLRTYFERLWYRTRFYRFYFYPPLYLALIAFLVTIRNWRDTWVALTALLFALGVNFFPQFQFHYLAAVVCLFVLMSVEGLRRIAAWQSGGAAAARVLVYLCLVQFVFWYGVRLLDRHEFAAAVERYDMWDSVNSHNPLRRIEVARRIAAIPGKLLIFVRYWPQHIFQDEWVYNEADIDHARVVWARDLGGAEDEKLRQYYPDRQALLLEPDATPWRLTPWQPAPPPPPPEKPENKDVPKLQLVPVQ